MKISKFVFNPFGENTYIVYDEATREAAIIDPGMFDEQENEAIASFIERNNLMLRHMVLTHVHVDHSFGCDWVIKNYSIGVEAHEKDAWLGTCRGEQCALFHLPSKLGGDVLIERPLKEGDVIELGPDSKLHVLEVPGHSPGSIALYSPENGVVFTGDALFPGSVGRTDIYGGDHQQLIRSIKEKLLTLPPETVVLAGHAGETTIGREKQSNPFLR